MKNPVSKNADKLKVYATLAVRIDKILEEAVAACEREVGQAEALSVRLDAVSEGVDIEQRV